MAKSNATVKKLPKLGTKAHQNLKWKESIEALNDTSNVKLAPSEIHGIGVFALRDIKKGQRLYLNIVPNMYDVPYKLFNKLRPEIREMILSHFPHKVTEGVQTEEDKQRYGDAQTFWFPVNNMQAYLNHADEPNYDGQEDKALKVIRKGEEITEDYRKIPGYQEVYPFLVDR